MTKEERALYRQKLVEANNSDIYVSNFTDISVQNTAIYQHKVNYFHNNLNFIRHLYPTYNTTIELMDKTTTDAFLEAIKYEYGSPTKIGILDFASFTNPGGGYLKGSVAQEEDLCEHTNLYNILIQHRQFYNENKKYYLNDGLYTNRQLYIPNVFFSISARTLLTADVVVCAAPNMKRYKENNRYITAEAYYDLLLSRIDSILNTFMINHNDILILGAFGCGVFENDPTVVRDIFKQLIEVKYKGIFRHIIFAIPRSTRNKNFEIFNQVFEQ